MIKKSDFTVCIICGSQRIFSKQWKEKVDGRGTVVTHFESICPNPECQKKVDAKFSEMREKREASELKRKGIVLARRTKLQV